MRSPAAEAAGRGGVLTPRFCSGDQTLVVAVQESADGVGEQCAVGLLGFDVHGAGSVVVGGDAAEVLRC